jgi:UDP-N-acetylglucosamine acyltransferase
MVSDSGQIEAGMVTGARIDPRANVADEAVLGNNVVVEAFATIGPKVEIGEGTWIGTSSLVTGSTKIGKDCKIFHGAAVGSIPQDLKFRGELSHVRIGDRNTIREFATIHLATGEDEETVIGDDNLLMAYVHIAHNCILGSHIVLGNACNLAGHVTVEDWACVSGITPIHQFVRIGAHSYVGGGSRVPKDIAPFMLAAGNPLKMAGLNEVGLTRRKFPSKVIGTLRQACKLLFFSKLNTTQALEKIRADLDQIDEIQKLCEFIESSERGIAK